MISHIFGSLLWSVVFYATFPWFMILLASGLHRHHVEGRAGFCRDYFLFFAPVMLAGGAFHFALLRTMFGEGGALLWALAALFAMGGLALFWLPPFRAAFARIKAAGRAARAEAGK